MQAVRQSNTRLPQAYRAVKATHTPSTRNMASLFYPRFVANEFAPVFRFLDDLQAISSPQARCGAFAQAQQQQPSFQPRFDVKESKDAYELKGELPGIEQRNIEVAFTDEKTLKITGHTESRREQGVQPSAAATVVENQTESQHGTATPAAESETGSYHKASVEEEEGFETVSESDANPDAAATPAETPATETAPEQSVAAAPQPSKTESSRYWVSERSTGRFSRTFTFPNRIDQELVSASLKDGILSIVVPKAPAPENRRIAIQ